MLFFTDHGYTHKYYWKKNCLTTYDTSSLWKDFNLNAILQTISPLENFHLNIHDVLFLNNLKSIFDICSQKSTFKDYRYLALGKYYN